MNDNSVQLIPTFPAEQADTCPPWWQKASESLLEGEGCTCNLLNTSLMHTNYLWLFAWLILRVWLLGLSATTFRFAKQRTCTLSYSFSCQYPKVNDGTELNNLVQMLKLVSVPCNVSAYARCCGCKNAHYSYCTATVTTAITDVAPTTATAPVLHFWFSY